MKNIFKDIIDNLGIQLEISEIIDLGILEDWCKTTGISIPNDYEVCVETKLYNDPNGWKTTDWNMVSEYTTSEWFIRNYWDHLSICRVFKHTTNIDEEFIEDIFENPEITGAIKGMIIKNQHLSESFIEKYKEFRKSLSASVTLKENHRILEKYKDSLDWEIISREIPLTEDELEKYYPLLWKGYISKYQKLSESFIESHIDSLDMYTISKYQKLSESFIESHIDSLDMYTISKYQKLSESFIESHKDLVDWSGISRYQDLSEPFIESYKDRIDWNAIILYKNLDMDFIKKYQDRFKNNKIRIVNDIKELIETEEDRLKKI